MPGWGSATLTLTRIRARALTLTLTLTRTLALALALALTLTRDAEPSRTDISYLARVYGCTGSSKKRSLSFSTSSRNSVRSRHSLQLSHRPTTLMTSASVAVSDDQTSARRNVWPRSTPDMETRARCRSTLGACGGVKAVVATRSIAASVRRHRTHTERDRHRGSASRRRGMRGEGKKEHFRKKTSKRSVHETGFVLELPLRSPKP